ncbi:MAG: hypothetical protein QM791_15495 [Ferruginibacter sp.]
MKNTRTSNRIIAAALLLLYIFIACPVQLWHHHKVVSNKAAELKISKATTGEQASDCKICQHTYTDYAADAAVPVIATTTTVAAVNTLLFCQYKFLPALRADNKSPPATC